MDAEWIRDIVTGLLGLAVVFQYAHSARRLRGTEEARLWSYLAIGLGLWSLAFVLDTIIPGSNRIPLLLVVLSLLKAALYTAALLAADLSPDVRHRWRLPALERTLSWPTALYFVGGTFAYCLLIPNALRLPMARTDTPGHVFESILGVYCVLRLAGLSQGAAESRWRVLFATLALAFLCLTVPNLGALFFPFLANLGAAFVPLAFLLLAFSSYLRRALPPPERPSLQAKIKLAEAMAEPFEKTLAVMVAFVLAHFGLRNAGVYSVGIAPFGDVFVFIWVSLGGFLAFGQHLVWRRRAEEAQLEMQRTERSLHHLERKLNLNRQRSQGPLGPLPESDVALLVDACPEMITLSRLIDGSFIEVNPACYELLGYEPEEMLGTTPRELSLWQRPRDRLAMIKRLSAGEEMNDIEIILRGKDGETRVARLSGQLVELSGEPCLLTTLRDGSARRRVVGAMGEASALLDGADFGVRVTANGRRIYDNDAALAGEGIRERLVPIQGLGTELELALTIVDSEAVERPT